ncbi:MAG: SoxR reducing system RseC family protein [Oscillospiraceae bacterium]|nr:SoxR reducing system RseC family protein [Oscillospiraceae bacterium]
MKQTAIVESVSEDKAIIKVKRESACVSCKSSVICNTCYKTITAEAYNKAGANVGDTVEIETDSKIVIGYAALTFVVPVVCGLLLYNITLLMFENDLIPYIFTFTGFILPFVILYFAINKRNKADIIITNIIEPGSKDI